ncbi:MAG: 60S ribosomal protein L31 [Candidatus Aenigmarchaeota archaeon]|nr:60S ribosomal protein L31 [Candidatus Aenigmarchaeota archaeon]MCX8179545.1 60S ribosomal protein L31 [Candidatus Aenigmarchaeota archaeon]
MAEKLFIISIRKNVLEKPRWEKSKHAIKFVREFLRKKIKSDKIKIDNSISHRIWKMGGSKTINKIKVKVEEENGVFVAKAIEEI